MKKKFVKKQDNENLLNRNFLLLLCGQIVSSAGNSIVYIGLVWWIVTAYSRVDSGIVLGTVLAFNVIPKIVLGPFAGVLIDRFSRKFIVVLSDILRAFVNALLAILIFSNSLSLVWLYLLISTSAVGTTFFNPAISSSIPNLVPSSHLTRANGLYQGSLQIVGIAGPAIGGLLVGFIGIYPVFAINALSYFFSAFSELFINFNQTKNKKKKPFFTEFRDGFVFIRSQKAVFYLMIMSAVIGFFLAPVNVLIAKQVKYFFNAGAQELGYVTSILSLGMIVGAFVISIVKIGRKFIYIFGGIATIGIVLSSIGYLTNFPEFLSGFFIIGFFASVVTILGETVLQNVTPDEKRGRVFGISNTLDSVLEPVSLSVMGLLTGFLSTSTIFLFSGVAVLSVGISAFFIAQLRKI